jgi:hypothetical protein
MELYIDLGKALNTARLVKRPVQVRGKNGKIFTRMQWVHPVTDEVVFEEPGGKHDEYHNRLKNMSEDEKRFALKQFYKRRPDRVRWLLYNSDFMGAYNEDRVINHLYQHIYNIPQHMLEEYLPEKGSVQETSEPKKDDKQKEPKKDDKQDFKIPVSLKHTNHGLPEKEVKKRHGEIGDVDLSKLRIGTRVSDFDDDMLDEDDRKVLAHIFKDITIEGLEHVFSHPKGEFTCSFTDVMLFGSTDYTKANINFDILDKKGKPIGFISRTVWRNGEGHLCVYNDELSIDREYTGSGMGDVIYKRSEQLWRHLSGGHPVEISLTANISVGVYAWAKKGFDFKMPNELIRARRELRKFCEENDIDLDKALKKSGYNSIDDLKHSWDFATLDDGEEYDLSSVAPEDFKNEIKGTGHLGKAFMLGGKSEWLGKKVLNADEVTEKVGDIHDKFTNRGE